MKNFSFSTIQEFDNHIANSVVGYKDLISDVLSISDYFVQDNMNVYDLGCSTGLFVKELAERHKKSNIIGVEYEGNFAKDFKNEDNVRFLIKDLEHISSFPDATMITSIFTMQFLTQYGRKEVLQRVYDSLKDGGCFVWSEKILSSHPKFQDMLTFMYYEHKRHNFEDSEILDKEKSLRSMMKCLTLEENLEILKSIGFSKIEVFWRRYNFVGILAIK